MTEVIKKSAQEEHKKQVEGYNKMVFAKLNKEKFSHQIIFLDHKIVMIEKTLDKFKILFQIDEDY